LIGFTFQKKKKKKNEIKERKEIKQEANKLNCPEWTLVCSFRRLPFVLPWCTDEDLSDKQNEIRRLYPFVINGSSEATYEFPLYELPGQILAVSKSA